MAIGLCSAASRRSCVVEAHHAEGMSAQRALTQNKPTRPSPLFAGLCFIRARATSIAPLGSSNRACLYTLVHTLHETTGTNGTRSGIIAPDWSTARHFLAQAQPRARVSQAECRGFESLCPLWLGMVGGGTLVARSSATGRGRSGALLGCRL